ncbi:MAG: energy-coupled thiamine transporter ThiT [Lachnospiraceae bacterium]|nr:energy-coupled thiamine transporter ThiT [Lachnospiraceae bacterium]
MKNEKTRKLVEAAVMVALATVLSFIRVYKMPWGGSVTLLSMLPIVVYSIRRGTGWGMICAFVFSLIQLLQGIIDGLFGWGLTPVALIACIFLDYVLAYSAIGIAGFLRKKGLPGWIIGISCAVVLRFGVHFLSGCLLWKSYGALWDGFSTDNTYLYSLLYNGAYMLPELILTLIGAIVLFSVPASKKFLIVED